MTEIISDPLFATLGASASKWTIQAQKGVVMTPFLEGSILRLEIANTQGANWQGALRYSPFPVAVGEVFSVSFAARAKFPFTFSVWLGQQDLPYKSLVPDENHFGEKLMTTNWQTFTHTWKPVLSEPVARLNFVLGQIENLVEIRDVRLTKSAV